MTLEQPVPGGAASRRDLLGDCGAHQPVAHRVSDTGVGRQHGDDHAKMLVVSVSECGVQGVRVLGVGAR